MSGSLSSSVSPERVGLVGLGRIGRNLALNLKDGGVEVVGFDHAPEALAHAVRDGLIAVPSIEALLDALAPPRLVMLALPAGAATEGVLQALLPRLVAGDIIVDLGNAHFDDTAERVRRLRAREVGFLGVGVAGGESGARYGAALMAGGESSAWARVAPVLRKAAARLDGRPQVALLGPEGSGHLAKVAHNAAEYAEMAAIAEIYTFLERILDLGPEETARLFDRWARDDGASYLLEITANILRRDDPLTQRPLIEVVLDRVEHTGTGLWAVQAAQAAGVAVPQVTAALELRLISREQEGRRRRSRDWPRGTVERPDPNEAVPVLENALLLARIGGLVQALELAHEVARSRGWRLALARMLRIWRAGGIVRSPLLQRFEQAVPELSRPGGLLFEPWLARRIRELLPSLRRTVAFAARAGLPMPSLSACLFWLEARHQTSLPTRMTAAQRDYFGGHGVVRADRQGRYHLDGTRVQAG